MYVLLVSSHHEERDRGIIEVGWVLENMIIMNDGSEFSTARERSPPSGTELGVLPTSSEVTSSEFLEPLPYYRHTLLPYFCTLSPLSSDDTPLKKLLPHILLS